MIAARIMDIEPCGCTLKPHLCNLAGVLLLDVDLLGNAVVLKKSVHLSVTPSLHLLQLVP